MKIKAKLTLTDGKNRRKAFGSLTINEELVITGIAIMEGPKGTRVVMPQYQDRDNKNHDVVFPNSGEGRKALNEAGLKEYKLLLKKEKKAA